MIFTTCVQKRLRTLLDCSRHFVHTFISVVRIVQTSGVTSEAMGFLAILCLCFQSGAGFGISSDVPPHAIAQLQKHCTMFVIFRVRFLKLHLQFHENIGRKDRVEGRCCRYGRDRCCCRATTTPCDLDQTPMSYNSINEPSLVLSRLREGVV
jgi:hypothetical protein